ncbi:Multidrug resistance-associated protein 1 [Galdieria sulphuraria]|uniref:Probable ATP-dependent transporter ycf16 n=1 Tax=Galdieria sulphuraria TaxID=130081 RepID=M2VT30_GALSU|nr:ABC transporter, multidrug-resistance, ATP-binding & transmembrane domain [Galdieria sulphuraria]EME26321.1 ABC transporter, multidrug-resistance, ATP-binding & transmembrane domain [Galdieria sulphuraria]GJD06510.1 Multidrug resistance-associated protein 1 [Galdieria sulphuraria]|eukprot:XP_005702841.1 ABC transporter, multidrug-resistance, ATP-binding & transmembrane domain [Galdieria sulphuraria]
MNHTTSGTRKNKYIAVPQEGEELTMLDTQDAQVLEQEPAYYLFENPEFSSSWLSKITFSWLNPLLRYGAQNPLEEKDLWGLHSSDQTVQLSKEFEESWEKEYIRCQRTDDSSQQFIELETFDSQQQPFLVESADQVSPVEEQQSSVERETVRKRFLSGIREVFRKPKQPSVALAIGRAFGWPFLKAAPLKFVYDCLQFVGPVVLNGILVYLKQPSESVLVGLGYCLLLTMGMSLQSLFLQSYFMKCYRIGLHVRNGVSAAVFQKSLRLDTEARNSSTVGEMVNLIAVDAQRIGLSLFPYLHLLWSGPFQIIVSMIFLYNVIGIAAFAGLALMLALIPLNLVLARIMRRLSQSLMKRKDNRVRAVNEMLLGIRQIKLFAWEDSIKKHILELRELEVQSLRKLMIYNAVSGFVWQFTPVAVAAVSFSIMSLDASIELTPARAFSALTLFNILRFPLNVFPDLISSLIDGVVSSRRIQHFLLQSQVQGRKSEPVVEQSEEDIVAAMNGGNYYWNRQDQRNRRKPILQNIHFQVNRGQLIAIVGPVGCGKTSILSALLGEMVDDLPLEGKAFVKGKVSYSPQVPWVINQTFRENILFGEEYDEERYYQTLDSCALLPDLDILPAGDRTEIGEKGINLSGGQKARIALARACYRDSDVYMLDDPLSAVDTHVAKQLFDMAIDGPLLKGKTKILVTHHIDFLSRADTILVVHQGQLIDQGTFDDLIARASIGSSVRASSSPAQLSPQWKGRMNGEADEPILHREQSISISLEQANGHKEETISSSDNEDSLLDKKILSNSDLSLEEEDEMTVLSKKQPSEEMVSSPSEQNDDSKAKLTIDEERFTGRVKFAIYIAYFLAVGGFFFTFTIFSGTCAQGLRIAVDAWLSAWSDSVSNDTPASHSTLYYVSIYIGLALGNALFILLRQLIWILGGLIASQGMHQRMLNTVIRAPMRFFDATPVGRILNRFAKDQEALDRSLPQSMSSVFNSLFTMIGGILVTIFVTPLIVLVLVPLAWIYRLISTFYLQTNRELKRLESITRSPFLAHFGETLNGVTCIRAFDAQSMFRNQNFALLDKNSKPTLYSVACNRWLGIRLDVVGVCLVSVAALLATLAKGHIDSGLAGLSITYALQVTGTLSWFIRMSTDTETQMNSVERILYYGNLESESAYDVPERDPSPEEWPKLGRVVFENVVMQYRPEMEPALRGISFVIESGQKVGIVGRTGAGKSSLTLALFRMVELTSGRIWVDDIDISQIGLRTLRSRISIITQDPILFTGTVRSNLDPFQDFDEARIWQALAQAHLKNYIESLPFGLDTIVADGGENFSAGQRQLLCLARCLLRKTKIIVMDEATAACDMQTDELIQSTIRSEFSDCTLIIIAHRLKTVIDADTIVVLQHGKVVQMGSPKVLLSDPMSELSLLVDQLGPSTARKLRKAAGIA